ncbi:MAG: hypothetical protein EA397_10395 [Deltaproteobacteria bacterium]|nr:MAG: hypothetical protein EA397_10395 [Deltaproteobacteria bacterium]
MTAEIFALCSRLHGLLAVLSLVLLIHPIVTLRLRRGISVWTARTADLGAAGVLATFLIGWWLYPGYRQGIKPRLLFDDPSATALFESKEHLALLVMALAVGGALSLRLGGHHPAVRRLSWIMLLCSVVVGAVTAGMGLWVAAAAHPAW